MLDLGRHPRLHRPRARDLDRGAFLDAALLWIEVQPWTDIGIATEVHELPRRLADPLLAVNVARGFRKPRDIPGTQLASLGDLELRLTCLASIALARPEDTSV